MLGPQVFSVPGNVVRTSALGVSLAENSLQSPHPGARTAVV
jgi:hypothetical protein